MSEKYTKADLRHIAEGLIEDLRECEDGTDITTWQLVKAAGYDMEEFGEWDLFDVHDALFRAAKANHITLDMSKHEGLEEGLPYNLDFIVHNKKAQIKCPHCGSTNTARYIYGYPLYDEEMQKSRFWDKPKRRALTIPQQKSLTEFLKNNRESVMLPDFSAHILRHTFCTRLCENETNLKVIQSVMGHADISTTMDIYADATDEKKQEIMADLQGKIIL